MRVKDTQGVEFWQHGDRRCIKYYGFLLCTRFLLPWVGGLTTWGMLMLNGDDPDYFWDELNFFTDKNFFEFYQHFYD